MEVKASLKHFSSTPRKARLVGNLIRGKNVNDALNILAFAQKRVAKPAGFAEIGNCKC